MIAHKVDVSIRQTAGCEDTSLVAGLAIKPPTPLSEAGERQFVNSACQSTQVVSRKDALAFRR